MKPYGSPGACSLSPHIVPRGSGLEPGAFIKRRALRPAVQEAMKTEGLLK